MRSYTLTRCRDCGHEEVRYSNVKRCRVCRGLLERPEPVDPRDAEIARLKARVAELEKANRLLSDLTLGAADRNDVAATVLREAMGR